jgi:hypothetical protein
MSPVFWQAAITAVGLVGIGCFIIVLVHSPTSSNRVYGWVMAGLSIAFGLAFASSLPCFLRCAEWTPAALRVPRGYKTVVVPTEDIAGIGMCYRKYPAGRRTPSRWVGYVFGADGSRRQLTGLWYTLRREVKQGDPSGRRRLVLLKGTEDELASTFESSLRSSAAGSSVQRLYDLVLEAQGPSGKLATLHMEKNATWGPRSVVSSYWSPDGEMGHVKRWGTEVASSGLSRR